MFLCSSQIFCVCAAVDVLLVRKSLPAHPPIFGAASTLGSGYVSFNPKGRGAVLMAKLVELIPHAKHMLMYRDARKVTDMSPREWWCKPSPGVFDYFFALRDIPSSCLIIDVWRPIIVWGGGEYCFTPVRVTRYN